MKLFHIPLKIIEEFSLTTTQEHQQLFLDVKEWEGDAVEGSKDKSKHLYGKLHKGVGFRLSAPFIYFFLVRWIIALKEPKGNYLDD